MATRIIDDTELQDIAVAIQSKDNGGQMTVDQMAGRISNIPVSPAPVQNPALILWDWEGTKLAAYSREDALALTELPAPDTFSAYADVDHDLLLFQSWNRSIANTKTWIQNHERETCRVGAIYITTDRQDYNFWNNSRLDTAKTISVQKRGTASIGSYEFENCYSLMQINIPDGVTSIGSGAFNNCYSLTCINIPDGVTSIAGSTFNNCYSLSQISIPDGVTRIGTYAFRACYSLMQINIPDGVIRIDAYAFRACTSLTCINIPYSVTDIDSGAFQYCSTLCDILNESKSTLSNANAFEGLPSIYRVYVPRADLSWCETATNWATLYTEGHIVAIEDYIDYLESIGFNVDKYKGATA